MAMTRRTAIGALGAGVGLATAGGFPLMAAAAEKEVIDVRVNLALERLWKEVAYARDLASRAQALLVMPKVVKGGFIVGGAYGEGALRGRDAAGGFAQTIGYYSVTAGSIGLQIGVQKTSHVLFFMTQNALTKFRNADGWEVGADAEVTFPDAGLNAGVSSTTAEKPVIGVVFGEDGLLIGASLEGAKYDRLVR